jgi:hypothetical protein
MPSFGEVRRFSSRGPEQPINQGVGIAFCECTAAENRGWLGKEMPEPEHRRFRRIPV